MSFVTHNWFDPELELTKKIKSNIFNIARNDHENGHEDEDNDDIPASFAGIGQHSVDSGLSEDSEQFLQPDVHLTQEHRIKAKHLHDSLKHHYHIMNGSDVMEHHLENTPSDEYDSHVESLPHHDKPADDTTKFKHAAAVGQYTLSSTALNKSLLKRHSDMVESGKTNSHTSNAIKGIDHPSIKSYIHNISALDNLTRDHIKTPHELDLFTGIHTDPSKITNKYGKVHLPAYTSSTTNYDTGKFFAKLKSGAGDSPKSGIVSHVLRIKYPKDSNGAYIAHHSNHTSEHEFLLPRGLTLKIHKNPTKMIDKYGSEIHIHDAEPVKGHK